MTRAAVIRTAAKAHWRHDLTGRAALCAHNDNQLASEPPCAGEGGSASIRNAAALLVLAGMAAVCPFLHNGDIPHAI